MIGINYVKLIVIYVIMIDILLHGQKDGDFYIWEHISHFTKSKPYIVLSNKGALRLKQNDQILFKPMSDKDETDNNMKYGEIIRVSKESDDEKASDNINLIVKINTNENDNENDNIEIANREYQI